MLFDSIVDIRDNVHKYYGKIKTIVENSKNLIRMFTTHGSIHYKKAQV